jgi:glycosyltransferase involved in cell wall biosynthesis
MTTEMREVGFRRIVQIPNGVELPPAVTAAERSHARDALRVSGKVALYVGRLDAEKGVDGLIRAWRTVHTRVDNATLLIVGHGPEQRRLEHLLREHPLSAASVQLRGAVRDVRPYLQAADLFILPSRSEGISIALLEALAAGLPVVATEVGGNREVLGGSDVGVLVPPNDPEHLASAISDALAAELDRDRVAAAARTHVAENFSLGHVVDAYEQLYARVLASAPGKRIRPCSGRQW